MTPTKEYAKILISRSMASFESTMPQLSVSYPTVEILTRVKAWDKAKEIVDRIEYTGPINLDQFTARLFWGKRDSAIIINLRKAEDDIDLVSAFLRELAVFYIRKTEPEQFTNYTKELYGEESPTSHENRWGEIYFPKKAAAVNIPLSGYAFWHSFMSDVIAIRTQPQLRENPRGRIAQVYVDTTLNRVQTLLLRAVVNPGEFGGADEDLLGQYMAEVLANKLTIRILKGTDLGLSILPEHIVSTVLELLERMRAIISEKKAPYWIATEELLHEIGTDLIEIRKKAIDISTGNLLSQYGNLGEDFMSYYEIDHTNRVEIQDTLDWLEYADLYDLCIYEEDDPEDIKSLEIRRKTLMILCISLLAIM